MKTFYWHDYETWGANPSVDRPSQFAGVRTDENLNIISDPLVIYCQPPEDIWPHPQACIVTQITPQKARAEGLKESEFIAKIHGEFIQPDTCVVGYNSLRFDDEVTRYTLYRNFYDPYEREWKNGNSRWDIIDMVRLCYALRPHGIEWPVVDARPSFKLENLTVANGISHMAAHDAFSDVEATIALARLVRSAQPQLYSYVLENKSKQKTAALINIKDKKPLLHISSRFPSTNGCAALVVPLAWHPVNKNAVIVYDLSVDPSALIDLDAETIRARMYTAKGDLPEGEERIPLKLVHINRCPVLLTPKLLQESAAARLNIDKSVCEKHWHRLLSADLNSKLREVFSENNFAAREDPEQKLYDGFLSDTDKQTCSALRVADAQTLAGTNFVFSDERLNEMVLRYKARNFPASLSRQELQGWKEHTHQRRQHGGEGCLSHADFLDEVAKLKAEHEGDTMKQEVLRALDAYAAEFVF